MTMFEKSVTSWFENELWKFMCERFVEIKMTVGIRIYDRKTNELMMEFQSITEAFEFVKTLAFVKLRKRYSRSYIMGCISGTVKSELYSVLDQLGIRVEKSLRCCGCPRKIFTPSELCDECKYYSDFLTKSKVDDTDSDSDEKLKCESCGVYSDDVIFQGDKCQACEVEFAEDPFGMFCH